MVLKREPTPDGPITELFDRLHELHLLAGEPGVRDIAMGIGRGVLSYTTVYNVFRGPRVPRWGNLDLIVEQLGGDVEVFRALWRAARHAELEPPALAADEDTAADHELKDRRSEFVVVTYQLPGWGDPGRRTGLSRTGFADPMAELLAGRHGAWVCWSRHTVDRSKLRHRADISFHLIELSAREAELHYEGYCNSTIWPLYHNMIERPEFHRDWQEANRIICQRFADAVARVAAHGATVWVQDYQLQLVPAYLRAVRPDLRIGFFLHISFPSVEIFLQLPGRAEILRGLLGCDLVGFERPGAVANFLQLVRQVLGLATNANSIDVDGRQVIVDAFPISVDVTAIERIVGQPEVRRRSVQVRAELGNPRTLLIGSDRLDYTKGIEQRLLAYGEILAEGHLPGGSVAFLQLGSLTREPMPKYVRLRERVERLAGHLNGIYGVVGRPVVHYTNQIFAFEEMIAMFMAADVMVVTPLSDGMNLVSKEYVASRVDNRGVLVLSEFAGAAAELTEAILVNPNDIDDLKSAILRAVAMSPAEQRRRMEAMRWHLRTHDVDGWISAFLTALDKASQRLR